MTPDHHLDLIHELAALERPHWAFRAAAIPAWHPRNEGEDPGEPSEPGGTITEPGTATVEKGEEIDGPDRVQKDDDWVTKARKHERENKTLRKRLEQYEKDAAERAEAAQSEQEKALKAARDEARNEAEQEWRATRRRDKLESQVIRLAATDFDDPEDALVFLTRSLEAGDIDIDELVNEDAKVDVDAVKAALTAILKRKPRLAKGAAASGSADQGEGAGGAGSLEDMSVEDHMRRKGYTQ